MIIEVTDTTTENGISLVMDNVKPKSRNTKTIIFLLGWSERNNVNNTGYRKQQHQSTSWTQIQSVTSTLSPKTQTPSTHTVTRTISILQSIVQGIRTIKLQAKSMEQHEHRSIFKDYIEKQDKIREKMQTLLPKWH